MKLGKSYAMVQISRAAIGIVLAIGLLAGAWLISKGGNAAIAEPAPDRGVVQAGTGVLHVDVSGVRSDRGFIIGSLCKEGDVFVSGCSLHARSKAANGVVSLEFQGLAPGDYALALFHDENNDSNLDFATEGIGFSNNANLAHAAPDFDASRFKVNGETRIRVRLHYSI